VTSAPIPPVDSSRVGRWATTAAATVAARGWPACTAGCRWPVDPAGDDGSGVHAGCERPRLTVLKGGKQ
jgi:hypothetical protein